jgi:plastocyanin
MNKKMVWLVVVAVVVLAGGGVALAIQHNNKKPDGSMSGMDMSTSGSTSKSSSGNAPTATNSVAVQNFTFSPADITVKKGTTVTWTNKDSITHTVTENDGQTGPDSGDLAPGKTYSFTFNTVGTFKYHCAIHPEMLGTVTVTD